GLWTDRGGQGLRLQRRLGRRHQVPRHRYAAVEPAVKEAAMNILAEPFWVPKDGNREEEYEDAVWPQEPREYEEPCVRFAVAAGAPDSAYAGRWARILVHAVGEGQLSLARLPEGLAPLRADWRQWMAGKSLPWYAEEKARQGAFAALVALELTASELG